MARALKVFRTAAGFDDAYVAAPSRAAALRAWGAERDLFARGVAEEVTDPALMKEPLMRPGEVIRRSRGTAAEQLAALPPARAGKRAVVPTKEGRTPDRGALDAAEAALARAEAAARAVTRDYDGKAAALARDRRAAERRAGDATRQAERARDAARRAYAEAGG